MLKIASKAPQFSLENQNGDLVNLSDFSGKKVLLWFVPRAFGKNWTVEAKGFRDRVQEFQDKNSELIGITFSSVNDLRDWSEACGLKINLLCDAKRDVAIAYGAAESRDQERATRISVLISEDGTILKIYEGFDVSSHPDEVLADLS